MNKKIRSYIIGCTSVCSIMLCLTACGTEREGGSRMESSSVTEDEQIYEVEEDSSGEQGITDIDALTQEQALEAVKNYCLQQNPDLKNMVDSDEYTVYWDVVSEESDRESDQETDQETAQESKHESNDEADEIVVLYRSYTGAEMRYYIDPVSGDTYVTEFVPGIMDEEQRTDESLNIRHYMDIQ